MGDFFWIFVLWILRLLPARRTSFLVCSSQITEISVDAVSLWHIATCFTCPISGFSDPEIVKQNKLKGENAAPAADPRGMIALARINWLHTHYKIVRVPIRCGKKEICWFFSLTKSNDEYLYSLSLAILERVVGLSILFTYYYHTELELGQQIRMEKNISIRGALLLSFLGRNREEDEYSRYSRFLWRGKDMEQGIKRVFHLLDNFLTPSRGIRKRTWRLSNQTMRLHLAPSMSSYFRFPRHSDWRGLSKNLRFVCWKTTSEKQCCRLFLFLVRQAEQ